ncbi:MAG: hypothetical protein ACLQIQ_05835, partial [Beijerinckiaceae bacterium]
KLAPPAQKLRRSMICEVQPNHGRRAGRHCKRLLPADAQGRERGIFAIFAYGVAALEYQIAILFDEFEQNVDGSFDLDRCIQPEHQIASLRSGLKKTKRLERAARLGKCRRARRIFAVPSQKAAGESQFLQLSANSRHTARVILKQRAGMIRRNRPIDAEGNDAHAIARAHGVHKHDPSRDSVKVEIQKGRKLTIDYCKSIV